MPYAIVEKAVHSKRLFTIKEANVTRRACNLREIKHGETFCLSCEKQFYSYDKTNERMCYDCRKSNKFSSD